MRRNDKKSAYKTLYTTTKTLYLDNTKFCLLNKLLIIIINIIYCYNRFILAVNVTLMVGVVFKCIGL